jgi:hypothetical protein
MTDPFSIVAVMRIQVRSLSTAARLLLDQMAHNGFAAPGQWAGRDVVWKPMADAGAVLEEIRKRPGRPPAVNFQAADAWKAMVMRDEDEGTGVWIYYLRHDCRHRETPELLARNAALLRSLAATGQLVRAYVERENGGVLCLPGVPFAANNANIVAMPPERAALGYDSPERFLEAGWKRESVNGLLFLERGMRARDNAEYLKEIIGGHWEMARAAKPKLTKYYWPRVEENERAVYRSGPAALELVGYVVPEKTVEFSCVLESKNQHVQGWEVYTIFQLIQEKKTADGYPVEAVRVVFFEAWMAEQEKRPLLDIGARVYYHAADGNLTEVTA